MDNAPLKPAHSTMPNSLDVRDEFGNAITSAIDNLAGDATFFTRLRLRKARGREAMNLAASTLAETMAAKRDGSGASPKNFSLRTMPTGDRGGPRRG